MFTPVGIRAVSAYRKVNVDSVVEQATPHQLIAMLFEGLLAALREAKGAMVRGVIPEKGRLIVKAVRILEEGLRGGLDKDKGGEVAANLDLLYSYSVKQLTLANLNNDVALIDEVIGLIEPVAAGWSEIQN